MKFNALIPELSVSNIKDSLHFYADILGFSIEYQREEEGFAFLYLGKSQIMIDEINNDNRNWKTGKLEKPLGRGINFQIEVKSITLLLANLKKSNIALFLEPEEKWYRKGKEEVGNKQFLVQDPEEYLLRFFEDLGKRKIISPIP